MFSQREAVFKATTETLKECGVSFTAGVTDVKSVMTDSIREKITKRVVDMFQAGEVELKATESNAEKLNDPKKLKGYVGGLLSNWFTKDKQLNGNVNYEPKNPGTKTTTTSDGTKTKSVKSVNDEKLKELITLRKALVMSKDENGLKQVNEAISQREKELNVKVQLDVPVVPVKKEVKKPAIDLSKIPSEFKDLLD